MRMCSSSRSPSCSEGAELSHLTGSSQHSDGKKKKKLFPHRVRMFIIIQIIHNQYKSVSLNVFGCSDWPNQPESFGEQVCYLGGWSQCAFSRQAGVEGGVADVGRHACRIREQILT